MDIQKLAYELYKVDWMQRISAERQKDALRNYYEEDWTCTFKEYLEDQGYSGELYVCFGEFLNAEYQDKEYIKELLGNDALYTAYEESLDRSEFEIDY